MSASRSLVVSFLIALVACGDNFDAKPDATLGPPCSDGIDNDDDGMIDFPDDLGCEKPDSDTESGPIAPQCSDNRDNDGDGKIDYPNDPGCPVSLIDDESDPCPGAGCPQCGDGMDNDGNGMADFPEDPGCSSAGDLVEFTDDPNACGAGMVIKQLPVNGVDSATLAGTTSNVPSPCGGGGNNPGIAYVFHLQKPMVVVASTDDSSTMIDTILDLRSSMCANAASEIACHDDITSGTSGNKKSTVTKSLLAGTYYLIVGGKTPADVGMYSLKVEFFPGEGTVCTMDDDCGPGLLCRIPSGETTMMCAGPVCDDGRDDDGDGKIDYPLDPGCAAPTDGSELDVCTTMPTDPACPACGNGLDDDMDGDIDYPADTSCTAASTIGESCAQSEAVIVATTAQTMGTTSGAINDFTPPPGNFNGHLCTSSITTHTAPDRAVQIDVPAMTSLSLRLSPVGFDSAHILLDSSCSGTPIECYDNPNNMVVGPLAEGRYYLIVDGYSTGSGTFTLNISGSIANGESCESALAQSGAITCGPGYACLGTVGNRVCAPTECNDQMDNNSDGKTDYPADPGCSSPSDPIEDTVCPGPSCPACSDGLDNDSDTFIDYPADAGCKTASGTNEGCPESDAIAAITMPSTMDTLVGATDDHDPSCVSSNQPDKIFTLDIPTNLQSLVIDTEDSAVDTVLSLMTSTCAEPSIACDDDGGVGTGDSLITRGNVAAGSYTIAVDSDSATLDTFVLNVKGTIMPGGSCESALFQAGVLVCPTNFGCNGPVGSRTCTAAQCLDGIDNNGDGTADYPNDPSCDSSSDNSEVTVCPGSSCPVCSDGIDNDNDGKTDYPADTRCTAASGTNEGCLDTDAIAPILMPSLSATLVGATDDHAPSCGTTAGVDLMYTLTVPQLESLTVDTDGSSVDTVLSLMTSDCSEPALACDDDSGAGLNSLITRQFVTAGTYTIGVDANSSTPGAFKLNVRGDIAPGASCESPLFSTGVLRCSLGFACDGPVGMRTCVLAECIDGMDNNGDGRTDFPGDPGCDSFSDDTESTVCPGPLCPVCSDGQDNDGDGATDYPADPSCFSASASNEACTQSEPIGVITQQVTTGNTAGLTNDYTPTCASSSHNAADVALQLDLPAAMATLSLNVSGFDIAHTLLDSTCGGTPIACSDPDSMTRTNVAAGTYYVVIDGWSTGNGAWTLTTTGTVVPGGSCEGALFQSGAFTCTTGHVCSGTPGSRTCEISMCNDMMDNDGDGKMDYPADPGCVNAGDNDEADDCFPTVGPNCPACSNAVDDDLDSMTDYPADTRCASASFFTEDFCAIEADLAGQILAPVTTGTLVGKADNYDQSCQSNTGNDVAYGLRLPVPVSSLQIDTIGSTASDTVLSLWNGACSTEIDCDDDGDPDSFRSLIAVTNLAAGDYAIQVDGFGTSNAKDIVLNVKGTVAAGTACTSDLFATGVLVCPSGTTCTGGTCQ